MDSSRELCIRQFINICQEASPGRETQLGDVTGFVVLAAAEGWLGVVVSPSSWVLNHGSVATWTENFSCCTEGKNLEGGVSTEMLMGSTESKQGMSCTKVILGNLRD